MTGEKEDKGDLVGFNVAYNLVLRSEYGWGETKPEEAFEEILDVKKRATALREPGTAYNHQAVASDLLRALERLNIDTPELSLKVLQTQTELYSGLDDTGCYRSFSEARLDGYNKTTRYLGDEKIAKAYIRAVLPELRKTSEEAHSTSAVMYTKAKLEEIAKLHPGLAGPSKMFPLSSKERDVLTKEKETRDAELYEQVRKLTNGNTKKTNREFNFKNVKDKAKDFAIGAKAYSAGKKLFSFCKEAVVDSGNSLLNEFKDIYKTNLEVLKQNPKVAAVAGAAVVFAGMGTANPAMSAAGACIMTAGILNMKKGAEKAKSNEGKRQDLKVALMNKKALERR